MGRSGLTVLLWLVGCDTNIRNAQWLSDPQAVGLLDALCEAELYEATPAQSGALTSAVEAMASRFIDDATATLYQLQQLGITPADSASSIEALDDARAEQLEQTTLSAAALDAYFREHEPAAHRGHLALVHDQVLTRCMDSGLCDRARAFLIVEADHLQRLTHP